MPPYAEVIGDPIAHSKSPAIHNFWLKQLGIAADYRATRVTDLEAYFEARRRDPDWRGCNVTAPHKQAVIPFLDEASPIGAVNCIVRDGDRLIGLNTDVDGVHAALVGADLSRVVLIGAGGAAMAVRAALADAGELVGITRQNIDRTELLAGATLIVNATPLGMRDGDPLPIDVDRIAPGSYVGDVILKADMTPFLQAAKDKGCTIQVGTDMLFEMIPAYLEFFGFATTTPDNLRAIAQIRY